MDFAVLDEKDIGAGALGDAAFPIQHHGVGIAAALGAVLPLSARLQGPRPGLAIRALGTACALALALSLALALRGGLGLG